MGPLVRSRLSEPSRGWCTEAWVILRATHIFAGLYSTRRMAAAGIWPVLLIQPPLRRREVPCDRHINGELASWC